MLRRAALFGKRALPAGALLLAGVWLVAGQAWGQSTPTHTFTLSSPVTTIAEPASNLASQSFTIQRDTSTELTEGDIVITISAAASGANPASGEDFRHFLVLNQFPVETVTFSGTDQMGTFRIDVISDNLNEPSETFTLSFSIATEHQAAVTANGGATLPGSHTVTITDNAADAITVSIAQSNTDADMTTTGTQVPEGRVALFTVTLSGGVSTAAVSVPYAISGGVEMADYTDAGGGTLSIPLSGGLAATTGVIRIALAVDADTTAEDLTVTLGATASEYSASGTIARTATTDDQSATISVVSRPSAATRTLTVTPAAGPHPEGDANATHTFTISFASGDTAFTSDTELTWNINHGGTNADDFTETSGVVTFLMGSTADVDFMVTIVGDNVNEADESFGVSLTLPAGDTMTELGNDAGDSAMVVIRDDDAIVLTFVGGNRRVAEEDRNVMVMLDFGAVLSRPMRVRIGTMHDADASTPNADFSDMGETGTEWLFAAPPVLIRGQLGSDLFEFDRGAEDDPISGTTTGQIPLPLTDDNINEANEVFLIRLEEPPTGAHGLVTLVNFPQMFTIVDDDDMTLSVTADKSTVNEGQEVQFSFELTGAGGTRADLDLSYTLTGASGYTPQVSGDHSDGVFRFGDSEVSGAITVAIPRVSGLGDSDPDRTLALTITSIERADSTMSRGLSIETDPSPGVINLPDPRTTEVTVNFVDARHSFGFSGPTRRIGETDSDVTTTYTVLRSAQGGAAISAGGSITITWAYAAGATNPVSNADFMGDTVPAGGTLVFTGSQTSQTFDIVTKGDNLNEADETFTLTLSIAAGDMAAATAEMDASLPASALPVAIADDDVIRFTIADAGGDGFDPVAEGADAEITVTVTSATPTADIVFPYGIVLIADREDPPAAASDYTDPGMGSITIASGDSSGTITLNIVDDDLNESSEVLRIVYADGWTQPPTSAGAVSANRAETGFRLTDNDNALLSIAADAASTGEGETAEFTVTTDHESAGDILVAWTAAVSNQQGTANPMSNPDISVTSGTATIAAGDTTASIAIPVLFDNLDEGATAETLTVTLGAVSFPAGRNRAGTVAVDSMNDEATASLTNLNAARRISAGVASATVDEGGEIEFQIIVRGRPIVTAFDVSWSLTAGTAQAADYSGPGASGMVTFAASSSMSPNEVRTETVRVTAVDDAMMEGAETLDFSFSDPCPTMGVCGVGGRPPGFPTSAPTLEAPSAAADRTVTATINASDSPVTLQIAGPGNALEEALASAQSAANGTFTISFTESVTTTADITVNWRLAFPAAMPGPDGTRVVPASAADFAMLSRDGGTARIAAGSSSVDIMVRTMADLIQEPVESFAVELVDGSASGGGGIVGSGLGISTDAALNSAAATIEASDDGGSGGVMSVDMAATTATQSVNEGESVSFSVQLVRGTSSPADIATDSTNMPTSSVPVDVTYTASITMQQGVAMADNPADNLDISGVTGCDGVEIAAADYMDAADGATIVTGCVRIPAGSTSQSFSISAVFDNLDEGSTAEEMVVEITGVTIPMNSGLQAPELSSTTADNRRIANINNVNTARTLAISATTASAEEGGDLVFTVTVEGEPVSAAFTVDWAVTTGAADISGATMDTVSFGISDMQTQTQTITLRANDDAESEAAETVTVTLTDPCAGMAVCGVGGRAGLGSQTPAMQLVAAAADGTILESDRPVTLEIAAPGSDLAEGSAANFTVSFAETVITSAAVEVDWAISFPAASQTVLPAAAADFTDSSGTVRTSGTVSIPAGMDSAMLPITAATDSVNESAERFIVTLSAPRGGGAIAAPALHATPTANATIAASDPVTVRLARSGTGAVREGSAAEFSVSLALTADGTTTATSSGDICAMFSTEVSQTTTLAAGANPNTAANPDIEVRGCDGNLATISATSQATGGVVIPAGQSSATLRIPVLFDNEDEGSAPETLRVALTSAAHTALSGASALTADTTAAMAMLQNVNALRTLEVSAADLMGDEDSASMPGGTEAFVNYTVRITGMDLSEEVSVDWSLAGAAGANLFGATASGLARQHGGDHTPDFGRATVVQAGGGTVNADGTSGTLVFPVGAPTSRTVRVPLMQDALNEGAESLTLTVTDPCPATGVCTLGGGGGGSSMTPALQLGTGSQEATIPASDPAMLRITRVGSGTVVSGEGVTYAVSLGNTFLNGRSVPVVASAPLTVMVPLQVGGMDSGQSFTVEVPTGQSSGQADVPDTVIAMALSGQTGTPMLSLGMAMVSGAPPGASGGSPATVTAPDPTSTDPNVRANLPDPVQTAAWELSRTAGGAEAPEGGTYEITFTLRGSAVPTGGLSFDWSVTGSAASDGGAPAVAADFARAAGYTCGAAADGATCTSLPGGTVSFTAGDTSQTIAIAVRDDSADNLNEGRTPDGMIRAEGFTLTFTALSGTDVSRVQYAAGSELPGTPLQVDIPALRADLAVANATAAEGASAVFQVALSNFVGGDATIQPVVVTYRVGVDAAGAALAGDTATLGADYTAAETSLTIPSGESSGAIAIPLVLDGVLEPRETFTLTITGATGGGGTIRLVPDATADPVVVANEISATGTITDDADQGARRRQRVGALVTVLDRQTALLATDAISARLSRARTDSAQSASLSIANRNLIGARNTARNSAAVGAGGAGGSAANGAQDIGLALYGAVGQGGAAAGLPGAGKSAAGRSAASRAANANASAAFGGLGAGLAGAANMGTRTALPSLAQVLNGSSFRFGAASDVLAGLADFADGIEVWGSGGYVDLRSESRSSGLTYDGESIAAFIGADAIVPQLPNLLAGLAVGWSAGDLDFTDRAGGFTMRGKLDNDAFSLHPYLGWQLSPHANAWLVLGIGAGSVDIEENEGSGASAISRKLDGGDSSMLMFSTGITGTQQIGETGDLKLRFALTRVQSRVDSGSFDDGALLPKTRGRSLRVGGEAEAGRRITLDNGLSLRPFGTLRVRLDNASAESGVENAAMDWGAGITAAWTDLGLDGRFAFRRQLNDTGDEEQGVSLDVNFAPGAPGQGIAISLQSALQQRRPGLSNLDGGLGDALLGANSALANPLGGGASNALGSASSASAGMQHSLSGEIAYGVALRYFGRGAASRAALLTPYGRFHLGSADTRWAAGLRLANPGGLQLGLEAGLDLNSATTDSDGAAAAPRSYDLLLTGRLRF